MYNEKQWNPHNKLLNDSHIVTPLYGCNIRWTSPTKLLETAHIYLEKRTWVPAGAATTE